MNNPLAQQAQYYLNESSRLSEELNTEIEYSAVLEAVLEELVGTENFLKIMEVYSFPGGIDLTASGGIRSDKPGRNNRANVTKRIGQLGKIALQRQIMTPLSIGSAIKYGKEGSNGKEAQAQQRARDAMVAFKTHGGQVSIDPKTHGTLLPSASNDNTTGIPMKHAKQEGVPVHIEPKGMQNAQSVAALADNKMTDAANAERLSRKSAATRAFIDRPADADAERGQPPRVTGVQAIADNAAKAKKKRMAAGQDAARKSGMVSMEDHYNLVQGIMNLLTSNKNENDLSEGQARMNRLSSAANKQQRNTGTVEPGLRSALDQAAGNQITRALGKTQYNTGQEIRGGNMVSSAQMGGAITPHQQALQNGDRLTGIKPDYANFGVGMGERSIVSANNRTGNFHPENDSAGGVFGHVTRVQKDGAILADRMQDRARIANARSGIKLGSRSATSSIAVDRLRK